MGLEKGNQSFCLRLNPVMANHWKTGPKLLLNGVK